MTNKTTKKASKTSLKPIEDRVLVLPKEAETKTASGLYLPDSATEKPQQGTIVAVGPGKLTDAGERGALSVSKGDTVLYGKYAGTEIDVNGVTHIVMRENELLAIVDD